MSRWKKIAIIPDTQCKPGVKLDHLSAAGNYIAEKEPDYIIHLGDNWDFPSLSSHDEDKPLLTENQDFLKDIEAGNEGMRLLTEPLKDCKAKRIILRGNHEHRMERERQKAPRKLRSLFKEDKWFNDKELGWQTIPFLKVIKIEGILFSHYFYNPRSGRPYTGMASSILKTIGNSFVQGHRQGLDIGMQDLPAGGRRRGIVAGSFYQHDEEYLGPQGDHWRGMLMLHEVRDGNFDLMEVSLDYLKRKYS